MSKQTKERESKRLFRNLKERYRLVLQKDETFEERFEFRLTKLNAILGIFASLLVFSALVVSAIIFTPLKEYIPGYADSDIRFYSYNSSMKADSINRVLQERQLYVDNLLKALNDEIGFDSVKVSTPLTQLPDQTALAAGDAEVSLREKVEAQDAVLLVQGGANSSLGTLSNTVLFPPLNGMVTAEFDMSIDHFGIDVVSAKEDAVKCMMDGTVIMASWTYDTGYVIQVQHSNDIISVYKHNAVLLKEVGDRVEGGEAIAIVGNSGEYTDGPHLHFEIWNDGRPVDPMEYLVIG